MRLRRYQLISVTAVLLALLGHRPALAQSTTFRVADLKDLGDHLEVTLAVKQGSAAAPIDVYAHGKLPRHRNVGKDLGPDVTAGMHLGQISPTPPAGQAATQTFSLSLADLAATPAVGVSRGGTLFFAIKLPATYNGGHEWGVHDGTGNPMKGSYCANTYVQIPAAAAAAAPAAAAPAVAQGQQNSRLGGGRMSRQRVRICAVPSLLPLRGGLRPSLLTRRGWAAPPRPPRPHR